MARKPANSASENKPAVTMALHEPVTGSVTIERADPNVSEPLNVTVAKGLTIKDGTLTEKYGYIAYIDGSAGALTTAVGSAVKSALEAAGILPSLYVFPNKDSEVAGLTKGDNKPKDPTTLEELTEEERQIIRDVYVSAEEGLGGIRKSEVEQRAYVRNVSTSLRAARQNLSKVAWGLMVQFAPAGSQLAALATSKNSVANYVMAGGIPDSILDVLPQSAISAKSQITAIGGARSAIAAAMVHLIRRDADLSAMGLDEAFFAVLSESGTDGDASKGVTVEPMALTKALVDLHLSVGVGSIRAAYEGEGIFQADADGKISAKLPKGYKTATTVSRIAIEGPDELVKAFASAWNAYVTPEAQAERKAMREKAAPLLSGASDFKTWDASQVAVHLFNILSGRFTFESETVTDAETGAESVAETLTGESADFAHSVVAELQRFVSAVDDGEMTVADVLASVQKPGSVPADEAEAESEGDAEA